MAPSMRSDLQSASTHNQAVAQMAFDRQSLPQNLMFQEGACHVNALLNLFSLKKDGQAYKQLDWKVECGTILLGRKTGNKARRYDFKGVYGVLRELTETGEVTLQDVIKDSRDYPNTCNCHFWLRAGDRIVDNITEGVREETYGQHTYFYDFPKDHNSMVYILSRKDWAKRGVFYRPYPAGVQEVIKERFIVSNIKAVRQLYEDLQIKCNAKIVFKTK